MKNRMRIIPVLLGAALLLDGCGAEVLPGMSDYDYDRFVNYTSGLLVRYNKGSADKLKDRVLIVEQAGSLSQVTLNELYRFLIDVNDCMLVLIDDHNAIEKIRKKHPDLAALFKKELVYVDMSADDLVKHAKIYAQEQDCIIDEVGTLALYSIIEKTLQTTDGSLLSEVEAIVDEAIEEAEKVSVGNVFKGIFGGKYNKEGQLVLKEEHFNKLKKDLFKE